MKRTLTFGLAVALAAASASIITVAPVTAADAVPTMDCTQAESMFESALVARRPAMTGDVDKDFMTIVMRNERVNSRILKIEALCGKDAKVKAMAASQEADSTARMQLFRNNSTSQ